MNTVVMVLGTSKPQLFAVVITNLYDHQQAGDIVEIIGEYPLETANWMAEREGQKRKLPTILHS